MHLNFCQQPCPVWLCSFCDIEHVVYECWTVLFWFITNLESLSHHSVITLQVPICYPVNILLGSAYNLTVFHISNKLDIVAFTIPEQYHSGLGGY